MTPPVKWGVYHQWCPMARPQGKHKYVVVVCFDPSNEHYGTFPISSHVSPLAIEQDQTDGYVELPRGRYPSILDKSVSYLDCGTLWPFKPKPGVFESLRGALRPVDRDAVLRAKDLARNLKNVHKKLIVRDDNW